MQLRDFTLCALSATAAICCQVDAAPGNNDAKSPIAAAEGVVKRMTPTAEGKVIFKLQKNLDKKIQIQGVEGKVQITGSNVRHLIAGYGWYLKNIARVHFSWNGDRLKLPANLPLPKKTVTIESPWKIVFVYNYCTLSYTAAFWNWERWQHEIDFLALSGFTHALVTAGLERVWQDFLVQAGYPKNKIADFIPNPAYAAWWNMGNLEGAGGPLSQKQIDNAALLGKRIVTRMKQLGLEPVLQGYVGFVPADFSKNVHMQGVQVVEQGQWQGYRRPTVVDPTCAAFPKLAADWYASLQKVYGIKGKMFGGDLFHEGGRKGNINVTEAARAVQTAMQKFSPGSVWAIQAWHGNPTKELLRGLKPQDTLILQLTKNLADGGKKLRTFDGIPWVWCELANFGGNTGLYGGVPLLSRLGSDLQEFESSGLVGMGTLSEGFETNPLHYGLFCDRFWTKDDIDLDKWLPKYARQRYGSAQENVVKALKLLANSIYKPVREQEGCTESIVCARPSWTAQKASTWSSGQRYYQLKDIVQAAREYIQAAEKSPKLMETETFRYDLADVVRQALADAAYYQLAKVKETFDARNVADYKKEVAKFLAIIKDMDALLATDPQFLLGTWQKSALSLGTNKAEKDLMDQAAKRLITTWINKAPAGLNDYSNRQWAGLLADFYLPRWQNFFEAQLKVLQGGNQKAAQDEFMKKTTQHELDFAKNGKIYPTKPVGNTLETTQRIMKTHGDMLDSLSAGGDSEGMPWDLQSGSPFTYDVTDIVTEPGVYTATFRWKEGASALKIHSVKLYEGDKLVAQDEHEGSTGWEHKNNTFTLPLKEYRKNLDSYTLKAEVSGMSQGPSRGMLIFKKKN